MSEIDLYAEYESDAAPDYGVVEVDLEFACDYDDAEAEAREMLEISKDDPIELNQINVYASDGDLQALADKVDWYDLFVTNKEEVIEDFLALDQWQQLEVMVIAEYHGISLRQAIDEVGDTTIIKAGSRERLFDDWLETNEMPDHIVYYMDKDKIIDDNYHVMTTLNSGTVVATYR